MTHRRQVPSLRLAALFTLFSVPTFATPACPIGNPTCVTYYTTSTSLNINYVNTPVMQKVNDNSTTLLVILNGQQVSSQTWALLFTDPAVQTAIASADTMLSGSGANFAAPQLLTSTSTLQTTVTTPPATYTGTCDSYMTGTTVPQDSYITNLTSLPRSTSGRKRS